MFVKVYRYSIQPEKTERFLDIQKRAKSIYDRHVRSRQLFLQNLSDPCQWLELHWYTDKKSYHDSYVLINQDPEIHKLWLEFQATLDPKDSTINEEYFEEVWVSDNLEDE